MSGTAQGIMQGTRAPNWGRVRMPSPELLGMLYRRAQHSPMFLFMLKIGSAGTVMSLLVEAGRWLVKRKLLRADLEKKQKPEIQVMVVVLTGGPCGGKSASMMQLKEALGKAGILVMVVPEVSTILSEGGASYPGMAAGKQLVDFETNLLKLQLQMEDTFVNIARTLQQPVVVLCDRGALDVAAFMLPHDWSATLAAAGVMVGGDLLRRYQLVVHMVTAAEGAEHAYTRDNNAARREDMKAARIVDKRLRLAWSSHRRHVVVDNSTDFNGKVNRVTQAVLKEAYKLGLISTPPSMPSSPPAASAGAPVVASTASV